MTQELDYELLQTFLTESKEHLETIDQGLIDLERNPSDEPTISKVFRAMHTIKGGSGFLGFKNMELVTHAGENLLNSIRDKTISATTEIISALLKTADAIREIISHIEHDGHSGSETFSELIALLHALHENKNHKENTHEAKKGNCGFVIFDELSKNEAQATKPQNTPRRKEETVDQTIRVNIQTLSKLMDLVGELVLSRNEVQQITESQKLILLQSPCQKLSRITSELQEQVLKTRMQPISTIWNPFQRIVRDLSLSCGKKVHLMMEGQDTELDKSLLETIKDPLTHLVRNAMDHGFEQPDERIKNGKNDTGQFILKARSESGNVVIDIIDDGKGIDPERIRSKAIEKKLITLEEAKKLSDKNIISYIFAPGFSTAEKVTNISGRGVGMDVVKTNIEKIGGTVEIDSIVRKGTTIRLKIPLTLAIMPALIVKVAEHQFAIPQSALVELIRHRHDSTHKNLEQIHGQFLYRLRGKLLPLIFLHDVVGYARPTVTPEHRFNIIVLNFGHTHVGMIVDEIRDTQEIVIKPLGQQFKDIAIYSGATIMGDSSIALILNMEGLSQTIDMSSSLDLQNKELSTTMTSTTPENTSQFLIVQTPDDGRLAIPIQQIIRLEKLWRHKLEFAGERAVTQYRGNILTLLHLNSFLSERRQVSRLTENSFQQDILSLIVMKNNHHEFGIIVDRIIDIIDVNSEKLSMPSRKNILGTAIIQKRITEFFDSDKAFQECSHEDFINRNIEYLLPSKPAGLTLVKGIAA